MKFPIKNFFSKKDQIFNGKLYFLCSDTYLVKFLFLHFFVVAQKVL